MLYCVVSSQPATMRNFINDTLPPSATKRLLDRSSYQLFSLKFPETEAMVLRGGGGFETYIDDMKMWILVGDDGARGFLSTIRLGYLFDVTQEGTVNAPMQLRTAGSPILSFFRSMGSGKEEGIWGWLLSLEVFGGLTSMYILSMYCIVKCIWSMNQHHSWIVSNGK